MEKPKSADKTRGAEHLPEQPLNIMFSLYYEGGECVEPDALSPAEGNCGTCPNACAADDPPYNGAA